MRFLGQNSISTNRDGTTANGRAKAFLTTFVWAPRSENAFLAVILGSKDVFETFLGPIKACMGGHFGVILVFFSDFRERSEPPLPFRLLR